MRAPPLHLRLWSRLCLIADSLELRPVALAAAAEPHLVNQENPAEYNAVVRAVMDVTKKRAQKLDAKGAQRGARSHCMLGASRSLVVNSRACC